MISTQYIEPSDDEEIMMLKSIVNEMYKIININEIYEIPETEYDDKIETLYIILEPYFIEWANEMIYNYKIDNEFYTLYNRLPDWTREFMNFDLIGEKVNEVFRLNN
jgi:hypothetical protein